MSVWFAIPSKRPPEEIDPTLKLWKERGYKVALWRDPEDPMPNVWNAVFRRAYPGYSQAVNNLVSEILRYDAHVRWIVTGGDDTEPDPYRSAEDVADECEFYFGSLDFPNIGLRSTFGVMQPTGDRWGEDDPTNQQMFPEAPALIDRVAGSPWMGREFCQRANQGRGPMWPEYWHMYNDEELLEVAKRLGVFWQRRDLTHKHNHWQRDGKPMPEFLRRANAEENYGAMRQIFRARKAAGFPGSEPLSV